jgi:hypothetical protein
VLVKGTVGAKGKQSRAIKYVMCYKVYLMVLLLLLELVLESQVVVYTLHSPGYTNPRCLVVQVANFIQ